MSDVDAITDLARAADVAWWGTEDTDDVQVRSWIARAENGGATRLLDDGAGFAAAYATHESLLVVDPRLPEARRRSAYGELLTWLVEYGVDDVDSPSHDAERLAALAEHGFEPARSQYDLERAASEPLAAPQWPDGVSVRASREEDAPAMHALAYSVWTDVPGHRERTYDEWRLLFFANEGTDPADHLVAERDSELVGVSLLGVFPGPFGWVSQLAVARSAQGSGVGRALLLASLRALADRGCPEMGLGVTAANRNALRLYESVGLKVTREMVICLRKSS